MATFCDMAYTWDANKNKTSDDHLRNERVALRKICFTGDQFKPDQVRRQVSDRVV